MKRRMCVSRCCCDGCGAVFSTLSGDVRTTDLTEPFTSSGTIASEWILPSASSYTLSNSRLEFDNPGFGSTGFGMWTALNGSTTATFEIDYYIAEPDDRASHKLTFRIESANQTFLYNSTLLFEIEATYSGSNVSFRKKLRRSELSGSFTDEWDDGGSALTPAPASTSGTLKIEFTRANDTVTEWDYEAFHNAVSVDTGKLTLFRSGTTTEPVCAVIAAPEYFPASTDVSYGNSTDRAYFDDYDFSKT